MVQHQRLHKSITAVEVFVLLECLVVHLFVLFLVLQFFWDKEERYLAENNPFSFLRIEKTRTAALNFVTMWCFKPTKAEGAGQTHNGWLGQGCKGQNNCMILPARSSCCLSVWTHCINFSQAQLTAWFTWSKGYLLQIIFLISYFLLIAPPPRSKEIVKKNFFLF